MQADGLEVPGGLGPDLPGWDGVVVQDLVVDRLGGPAVEGAAADEELVHRDPQAEDVRASVQVIRLAHLLGGPVERGPRAAPGGHQRVALAEGREAKVSDDGVPGRAEEDVGGLDVPVDDPRGMQRAEASGDLLQEPRCRTAGELWEPPMLLGEEVGEGSAVLDVLGDDVVHAAIEAHVVEGEDGGVVDVPADGGFALEASELRLGEAELGQEHLDRNLAPDGLIEGAPHRAGAPSTDGVQETVPAQEVALRRERPEGLPVPPEAVDVLEHPLEDRARPLIEVPEFGAGVQLARLLLPGEHSLEGLRGAELRTRVGGASRRPFR